MAANRIKGITIEIGGDTTKLQTALKGVNTEIRNTQSQLKDVEKLLKLDPGNTELLSQKQKLLAQAVSETKEKLETLKIAAEQANTALANGEISQSQYDALQREIVETEQELKRLEEQANQSATAMQKIAATGEQLKDVGGNIESAGKKMLPVTATVTALGTASVKMAADFEAAMSKVAAVSGASASEMEALTAKAREMGSKTKFSASEAAEAMNYMAMAGWKTEDMLSGIEGVMNLAAASGEDLATTSDIVTDALTAFGLTAQDSGHFADVLAAASSNANTNVSMMGETFKYCAPIAGSLGFSVEDTAEAIGLMANAGIKSTQAGTSLRTIMANLSGEVKICGANIGEVTIATSNADGTMRDLSDILADCRVAFSGLSESEKAAAAESLVGKNAMSGFLALMNAGEGDINKLSGAIDNCDGAAQNMADTMNDNLEGQLTILKSALEELAISFGQLLIPALREVVQWLQGFIGFLNSLPEGVKKTIMVIALVAAALGPVLIIIGKVISAIGTIMTIVPKVAGVINVVKGAFAALNATMLANPIVLIIAAIAALVAAFIYLWNNCEGFRQFWINLWENVKQIAVAVWEGLKTFFAAAWQAISTTAQTIWNGIRNFFSVLWEGIKTIFTTVLNVIKTIVTTYFNVYKTIITTVFNAIRTVITTILNAIKTVITTVWNTIKNVFTTVLNTIKSVVSGAFNAMWTGIKNTISGIVNTIKTGFNNAVGFIKSLASSAFRWGADIVEGIVNGIKSCIGKVKDAVCSVADTIKSFLHFSVPDEGPLTEYESWMPDFMSGLAKGIENSKGMVKNAVSGLAADMVINPQMNGNQMAIAGGGSVSSADLTSLVGAIREAVGGLSGNSADIVIPVYIGGTMLDEVIVNAQQRANLRSGGR
ncbi:phage tail tape measure protein [Dorea longicatena]|uniref:phage tail tape measure protein n=1 Tax=Dorea longicatena TaxID=88431 RepID=UPI003F8958B8